MLNERFHKPTISNTRAPRSDHPQILINRTNSASLLCLKRNHILTEAWLLVMTRYYSEDKSETAAKWCGNEVLSSENGQMLKAGVNSSFRLHSLRSTVVMHCCCCGEPAFSKNPLTAGPSSCSASSVFNMLSMFHSPKWVYDNTVLQRNLSKDRKRKRNRACCSWKQWSSLWNWHLWNHEWKHSLLYWLDSSPLQPNPFKNLSQFDRNWTKLRCRSNSYSQHTVLNINSCNNRMNFS